MPRVVVSSTLIKSHQRMLATKSGLEVAEKKTMSQGELSTHVLNAFNRQCKLFFENDSAPEHLNCDMMLHKNQDLFFTGPEVWEMYLDTKRSCINIFNPKWNAKLNADGTVPSGKDKDTLLQEILDEMWLEKEEERVAKHIKAMEKAEENGGEGVSDRDAAKKKMEIQPRPDDWQPLSWLTFVTLGAPSDSPRPQLIAPSGNAPRAASEDPTVARALMSRKEQRKEEEEMKAAERQKQKEASKLAMITAILKALRSESTTNPRPSGTSTPPAAVQPAESQSALRLRMRESRRAELQLLFEISEGDEKQLAKQALIKFLRDPTSELEAVTTVSLTSLPDMPVPANLFGTPPPPPPADTVQHDSEDAAAAATSNPSKRARTEGDKPAAPQRESTRQGKGSNRHLPK